jgi:hypothetical protein
MTEVAGSERSGLDTGDAADGRSDPPMDMAMEMAMAVTSITAETAGATIVEPMERHDNGKRRRRREAPVTPNDWRSRKERVMRQQPQELMQLHRTVGHLTHLVQAQAAREGAQWLGMTMWMQQREQQWEARHEDDKVWGAGIKNMIAKTLNRLAQGQER